MSLHVTPRGHVVAGFQLERCDLRPVMRKGKGMGKAWREAGTSLVCSGSGGDRFHSWGELEEEVTLDRWVKADGGKACCHPSPGPPSKAQASCEGASLHPCFCLG